jgi:signal transduction histidine kinase
MLALAAVQVVVIVGGMAAWMLTSTAVNWEDVAAESASARVLSTLARDSAGAAVINPDAALLGYAARRPGLRHAALIEGRVLAGSSPDLSGVLARLGPDLPREGRLAVPLAGAGLALFRLEAVPGFGDVVVVTAGNAFYADEDLGVFFSVYLVQLLPMFGPALLAGLLVLPLALRRALRPLQRAAEQAAAIDLQSLDRRLDEALPPAELRPFIRAINALLARIESGVRAQRLFTANAAHELRTPVAILRARVDGLPATLPERLDLARDLARITIMLDQLLAVARIGQQGLVADQALDVAVCARNVVADMAPLAIRAGRAIALEAPAGPLPLRGDARALEGALANLLDNALRAEPVGGTVVLAVRQGVRISVVDHGAGVAAQDRALLFEPFWRKDERTRGSGLGLAIVREVARLHGGSVMVQDTPGGGATFVLDLPPCGGRGRQASAGERQDGLAQRQVRQAHKAAEGLVHVQDEKHGTRHR